MAVALPEIGAALVPSSCGVGCIDDDEPQETNVKRLPAIRRSDMNLVIRIAEDDRLCFSHLRRSDGLPISGHCANVGLVAGVDRPAAQNEWNGSISGDPFTVVFSDEMQMSAGGYPAFA